MTWNSDTIFSCIKSHILMHFIQEEYLVQQHPNFWACDIVGNWDSSVSIVTRIQVVSLRNCYSMSNKDERFLSPSLRQTGSGIHSISYSVVTGVTSMGLNQYGMKLTAHRHLVLRLRMSAALLALSHMPLWWQSVTCMYLQLMWYSWTQQVG